MEPTHRRRGYLKCDTSSICGSNKEIYVRQKATFEPSQYKTKCNQCKKTIQQIRNLLDEIVATKEISTIITTCKCCKKIMKFKHCQKCDAMAHKFLACQDERTKVKTFTEWLLKLKYLLTTLLHAHSICQHTTSTDTELERILNELRSPICARKPVIEYFPDIGEHQLLTQSISESKDLLDILLSRIEPESDETTVIANDSVSTSCIESCICKLLKNKMPKAPTSESSIEYNIDKNLKVPTRVPSVELNTNIKPKETTHVETGKKVNQRKQVLAKSKKSDNKITLTVEKSDESFLKKMIEKKGKNSVNRKENMKSNVPSVGKTYDRDKDEMQMYVDKQLADALAAQGDVQQTKSSTFVECEVSESPKYVVKSTTLLPYDSSCKVNEPLQLYIKRNFLFGSVGGLRTPSQNPVEEISKKDKKTSGIISYQLSDRTFINNGWTELPQEKIMRRMNMFKMEPVDLKNNWFEINKNKKTLFYDSGEILANINDGDECGIWFYRNGSIALEYYYSEETNYGCRCVVYSCGDSDRSKESVRTTIAIFDFYGNGVIYDNTGNVRMKYNQSEGVIVDPKIAFPSRWKWHALNEPPVLKLLRVNSHLDPKDPVIEQLEPNRTPTGDPSSSQSPELIMQQIEAEMLVKKTLKSSFKHLVMAVKVAKLNECFTLRISAQTKILLTYRVRSTVLKLNLGMTLNSNNILGFDFCEANEVEILYPTKRR